MIYTKEKFVMCYMSMTIYNINPLYLLLSILSASYFICLYRMFVFAKAREITRTNHFHQYRNTCHTCDNASTKLIMV